MQLQHFGVTFYLCFVIRSVQIKANLQISRLNVVFTLCDLGWCIKETVSTYKYKPAVNVQQSRDQQCFVCGQNRSGPTCEPGGTSRANKLIQGVMLYTDFDFAC